MKSKLVLICAMVFFSTGLKAQESTLNTGLGFGFQLVQYQDDFGIGFNVVSPYFLKKRVGVRLKANLMYNENVVDGLSTWIPYSNVSLGVIGVGGYVNDRIRLYGEGGMIGIIPSPEFSSSDLDFGGYGVFGFEFFFGNMGNYFVEVGGMGTGAVADKIATQPIYSNGMSLSTGFRFFLK